MSRLPVSILVTDVCKTTLIQWHQDDRKQTATEQEFMDVVVHGWTPSGLAGASPGPEGRNGAKPAGGRGAGQ